MSATTKKTSARKSSSKAAKANARSKPGVIDTIVNTIARKQGAGTQEILAVLVKAFPDREADGMLKTVRIQANKNCKRKTRDEKRGVVYFGNGKRAA